MTLKAENILEALPAGVVVADTGWQVRFVSRTLLDALGLPAEQVVGKHICLLSGRHGLEESPEELGHYLVRLALSPPERAEAAVLPSPLLGGKFVRLTAQPYPAPGPACGGYLFTFTDYSREATIDEMKSQFISVASHELRTPMTSIKGSLELLLGGYAGELPAEATELLGISLTAVDRLVRLINDLLDIAKIESGKVELHLDRLNVADCVHKSIRSLRSLAEAGKVSIQVSVAAGQEGVAPEVFADRDRLEQVITNLLSNALKYSPPEAAVQVSVTCANGSVRVSVADQGPGVPAGQMDKVFDRFHQLQGAKKGTGLGLAICRALIEQHRGRIWVESNPGKGANFQFELPAAR